MLFYLLVTTAQKGITSTFTKIRELRLGVAEQSLSLAGKGPCEAVLAGWLLHAWPETAQGCYLRSTHGPNVTVDSVFSHVNWKTCWSRQPEGRRKCHGPSAVASECSQESPEQMHKVT